MRIVAIDPSLTRTGICVWDDGEVRTFSAEPDPKKLWQERVAVIVGLVGNADLYVIETMMLAKQAGAAPTTWLHGILRWDLWHHGAPVVEVAAASWQKWACGHQADRSKDAWFGAAIRAGSPAQNNDEAAAWWMADMAAHAYGLTNERLRMTDGLAVEPAYRLETLAKVEWPEFDTWRPDWKALLPAKKKRAKP